MTIHEHLMLARNGLAEIESLTNGLSNEPSIDDIDEVLRKRDVIVCRMKSSVHELDSTDPGWANRATADPGTRRLYNESRDLLRSVGEIDSRIAQLIETRMAGIKQQLSFLYKASRAASSYTTQSAFRTAG
jgi:hypothetical protein